MGTQQKVDRATPQIPQDSRSAEALVTDGNDAINKINASSAIGSAPDVKSAVAAWATVNSALDTNNKAKANARVAWEAAVAAEAPLVRRWGIRRRAVISALEIAGDGSAEAVQAFNVPVLQRQAKPQATVPANLRAMKVRRSGNACVRWNPTAGADGYMLQHATNQNDPTTYSTPIHVSGARYYLPGQTAGATIWFRVAALDASLPGGQTAYSVWVPAIVPE